MRPRSRDAVSVFVFQIGSITFITKPISTRVTSIPPITGPATVSRLFRHCWQCLGLRLHTVARDPLGFRF